MPPKRKTTAPSVRRKPAQRYGSPQELELAVVEAACAKLTALTGRQYRPLDRPTPAAENADEARARKAIDDLRAAVDNLAAVARSAASTPLARGRLAGWAAMYGARVVSDIRGMRVPWEPLPAEPRSLLGALIHRVYVDKRDLLGLRREPTHRELAYLAIVRGYYYPDMAGSRFDGLVNPVVKRAESAVRQARKRASA